MTHREKESERQNHTRGGPGRGDATSRWAMRAVRRSGSVGRCKLRRAASRLGLWVKTHALWFWLLSAIGFLFSFFINEQLGIWISLFISNLGGLIISHEIWLIYMHFIDTLMRLFCIACWITHKMIHFAILLHCMRFFHLCVLY